MPQMKQLVLATTLAAVCGSAHAFDGDRRGFMIGVGGGLHTTDFDVKRTGFASSSSSKSGAEFRLMIGSGISERLTVYGIYDIQQDGEAVYGLLGPGATFYLRGPSPSAYFFRWNRPWTVQYL